MPQAPLLASDLVRTLGARRVLDGASLTELEDAFGASPGAIVVATHDRWLRARWRGTELRLGGAPG
jgi:hypothetical protein